MASFINIHEAKTHLSRLVGASRRRRGDRRGQGRSPTASSSYERPEGAETDGGLGGRVWIAEDFDELPEDIAAAFPESTTEAAAGHACRALVAEQRSPTSTEARAAISDPESVALVSAASAWEMAIKAAAGKPPRTTSADNFEHHSFTPLAIELSHGLRAGSLPMHHTDPFDRLLIAQAEIEGLTLVTRDRRFTDYDIKTRSPPEAAATS